MQNKSAVKNDATQLQGGNFEHTQKREKPKTLSKNHFSGPGTKEAGFVGWRHTANTGESISNTINHNEKKTGVGHEV